MWLKGHMKFTASLVLVHSSGCQQVELAMKEVTQEFKSIRLPARLVGKTLEPSSSLSVKTDCQRITARYNRATVTVLWDNLSTTDLHRARGRHTAHSEVIEVV